MLDWRCALGAITLLLLTGACVPVPPVPDRLPSGAPVPDAPWTAVTVGDLEAVHDLIRDHHPGPVDPERPGFGQWLVEGFFRAQSQANGATSYAGYVFALHAYVNGFRDASLRFEPALERRFFVWPGFVVGHDGRSFRVASREERLARLPPVGSRLLSCDGQAMGALAENLLAPYFGNWQLASDRRRFAPELLIDRGNPWVDRPRRCEMEIDGVRTSRTLAWTGIRAHVLAERVAVARGYGTRDPGIRIGIRPFAEEGLWIVPAWLDPEMGDIDAQLRTIRRAPVVVLDLRVDPTGTGTAAGSGPRGDVWVRRIWGDRYVEALRPRALAVDWRASVANADHLTALVTDGADGTALASIATAMRAEAASGGIYHRVLPPPRLRRRAGRNPMRGQVFVITDSDCADACLETVDLLRALEGVRQVGASTAADSLYGDDPSTGIRRETLPSGLAALSFGINVVRDRPRGHNQPQVPTDPLPPGAVRGAFDLEAWIEGLALQDAEAETSEAQPSGDAGNGGIGSSGG